MKRYIGLFVLIFIFIFTSTAIAQGMAEITVIHGIPDAVVDVYANGGLVLDEFEFGTIADTLELPPDEYTIEITPGDDADNVLLEAVVVLEEDKNYSAIAHLTYPEGIKLSLFENDVSPLYCYKTRLTLRHTANAPSVDIDLVRGRWRWFSIKALGLSNPQDGYPSNFSFETYRIYPMLKAIFYPAGQDTEVFRSDRFYLRMRYSYIVYAVGSIEDGTFGLLVQKIRL
jgi:hypothetical protein